jgi:hypothetical protein
MRHEAVFYVVVVAVVLLFPLAGWSAAGARVEFSSGSVSIVAENATLSSVAEQLSKTAGVNVYLDRAEEARNVSVDIQGASFEKGLKNLVYPLNFAIVSDQNGTVTEVRIFKNTGLIESGYRLFAALTPNEAKPVPLPDPTAAASGTGSSAPSPRASQSSAPYPSKSQSTDSLAGPSRLLTGEKAFQANVWTTKQMMEADQVRQNIQVKADQMEAQAREIASVTSMIQTSNPSVQQEQTPLPQTSSGNLAAQQSQQSSALAYQQYASQQTGFNSSIYYQQWMMRENYSFYNMRRGQ